MAGLFSRKEKLADLFSAHVPPHIPQQLAHPPAQGERLSQGPVEFIFVMAQGHGDQDTAELIGAITADAHGAGWMVQALLCNLVVLVRGTVPLREPPMLARAALVDQLMDTCARRIKAVHGAEQASFGTMEQCPQGPRCAAAVFSSSHGPASGAAAGAVSRSGG